MTDYFALLDQPRRPWLDSEKVKEKYHQLARTTHPDQKSNGNEGEFAALNEAYRVLLDPKLRLRHLLQLEDAPPAASTANVPAELGDLFLEIGPALQRTGGLFENASENALTKSLKAKSVFHEQKRLTDLAVRLRQLHDEALQELQELDERWANRNDASLAQLERLYERLAFLGRWTDLIEERRLQLSS
jgi:curved DNA-binding protein CbpA